MDMAKISSLSVVPAPRIRRHIFVVKRGLQMKFIVLVLGCVSVGVSMMGWDIYQTFGRDIVRDLMDPGLYELFHKIGYVLLVKVFLYLLAVTAAAVYLSHKLAGPIYRFERSARVVAEGDLTHQVHLRKGDELMDLQEEFNAMVSSLREKVSGDADLAKKISKKLGTLSEAKTPAPDVLKHLKEIRAEVDCLTRGFRI